MEALQKQTLRARLEAAKEGKLCQHGAVTAGKVRQETGPPQRLATDHAETVRSPARTDKHLPEPGDRACMVADLRTVGLLPNAGYRIEIIPGLAIKRKRHAIFVNEGGVAVSKDDVRMVVEQHDAALQIGLAVQVVMGRPFEQWRRGRR